VTSRVMGLVLVHRRAPFGVMVAIVVRLKVDPVPSRAINRFSVIRMDRRRLGELRTVQKT